MAFKCILALPPSLANGFTTCFHFKTVSINGLLEVCERLFGGKEGARNPHVSILVFRNWAALPVIPEGCAQYDERGNTRGAERLSNAGELICECALALNLSRGMMCILAQPILAHIVPLPCCGNFSASNPGPIETKMNSNERFSICVI